MPVASTDPAVQTGTDPGATIHVEVVYVEPGRIWQRCLQLSAGTNAGQAFEASQFIRDFPEYAHNAPPIGVYGRVCTAEHILVDGDRLEIYRPLIYDPMESRRRRAIHRRAVITKPANRPKRRRAAAAEEDQEAGNVVHTTK